MKLFYLVKIFNSNYCKIVFLIGLIGGYFLIPKTLLDGFIKILSYLFIFLFALIIACIVRNIKERIVLAKTYSSSIISAIATGLGLVSLHVCGIGAPMCGATIGLGIASSILPSFFLDFITNHSLEIFIISIIFQLLSLFSMRCFVNVEWDK